MPASNRFAAFAPALFVFLWSTGFVGAKFGLPHAEPLTFLCWRFVVVLALLAVIVPLSGARWPRDPMRYVHLAVSGWLMHGLYLGGVFSAIKGGLSAGMAALIVGVQPLLTALIAGPLLGERLTARQRTGFALGFVGLALVLGKAFGQGELPWPAVTCALVALAGITAGTLYQKRYVVDVDLWTGAAVQYVAALALCGVGALAFETRTVEWTGGFMFALGWLCIVLSLGAIGVLWVLIRHGAAGQVASLFYLVPPTTVIEAWLLFGETLSLRQVAGVALTAAGVAMIRRA